VVSGTLIARERDSERERERERECERESENEREREIDAGSKMAFRGEGLRHLAAICFSGTSGTDSGWNPYRGSSLIRITPPLGSP